MTRNEHVYAIQNIINAGPQSDDNRMSNRLIYHFMKISRARLVKQKADNHNFIAEDNFQRICMPLIKTQYHDCDCVPNSDCLILRSKYKLPKQLIPYLGSTLQVYYFDKESIGRISIPTASQMSYSRIEDEPVAFFFYNGYIYITGTLDLKAIEVYGVWEDPEKAETYTICSEDGTESTESCYDAETDLFPIDGDLVFPMYQLVLEILNIAKRNPEDNENNARTVSVAADKEE